MSTRKFSRVTFRIAALVSTASARFEGEVQNISMNGMFLRTTEQLPPGTQADITISLNGIEPEIAIHVNGTVSRTVDDGIGFTFGSIDLTSYTHLKNIVSYNTDDADKIIEEIHSSIDEKYSDNR
jgi:hypothetical protein